MTHDDASGDYLLLFNNGAPDEITVYNWPLPNSISHLNSQAFYATDTWNLKQVTLDLGIRWERYHAFNPTQTKPAGQFADLFPAQTFPAQDLLAWKSVVPRIGAAWNLGGKGKTVIKGFFGIFGDTPGDAYGEPYNPMRRQALLTPGTAHAHRPPRWRPWNTVRRDICVSRNAPLADAYFGDWRKYARFLTPISSRTM